jgi:hypothetical protein
VGRSQRRPLIARTSNSRGENRRVQSSPYKECATTLENRPGTFYRIFAQGSFVHIKILCISSLTEVSQISLIQDYYPNLAKQPRTYEDERATHAEHIASLTEGKENECTTQSLSSLVADTGTIQDDGTGGTEGSQVDNPVGGVTN